jgi:CRISPR-associated protein Cas1
MTDRILDLSESAARLSVRDGLLVVAREGQDPLTIPLADVGVLLVSHPQVSYTHAVLAGLVAQGGAFVTCDERHLPVGMLLPVDAHYVQTERFALQARASLPTRKRLWRQVVRAKVRAQGNLLAELHGDDLGLLALAQETRSGDSSNVEAQASRRYWPALFADAAWRRNREAEDQNRFLNYGYAVLRAIVARAVCAAGLHPSLGLHHHNRYNSFCLADDLMEPLRPIVDRAVYHLVKAEGPDVPLGPRTKAALLQAVTARLQIQGHQRSVFDVAYIMASSLVAVLEKREKRLILPEFSRAPKGP